MLYWLLGIAIVFLIINYVIADYDYLHPSFIFCLVFFMSTIFCIIEQERFEIVFHLQTVLVVGFAMFVFTLVSIWAKEKKKGRSFEEAGEEIKPIYIKNYIVIIFIGIQIITLLYFVKYLQAISIAHHGQVVSLSEMISLYDTMTKFWTSYFNSLNIAVPFIYRLGNPISQAGAYLILYIAINNYVANKKINILHLISIGLLCVFYLLNGSRSPLLRILTMAVILFYVMKSKKNQKVKGNIKYAFVLVLLVLIAAVGFVVMLSIMGRDESMDVERYLFIYLGAPLVNLDNFLADFQGLTIEPFLGAQTFRSLYAYVGKLFNISEFSYAGISQFAFSNNGIEIGNVYTTFYQFIYDFGYIGVLPLILIIAIYYVRSYVGFDNKLNKGGKMNFSLFIYSYLFNDLIMLFFSNRFYTTLMDAPFIKLFIVSWVFKSIFIENKLFLGKNRLLDLAFNKESI